MKSKPQGKLNIKTIIKGILNNEKKINIAPKAGSLAKSDSAKANAVTEVMNRPKYIKEMKPYKEALEKERDKAMKALELMNPGSIDYDKLVKAMEVMTKQIELLSGNATERNEIDIAEVKLFLGKA